MKKLTFTSALALLGAAVLGTAAHAQSASQGDLILGFQVTSGSTNSTLDFETDLGQYTNFTSLSGGTTVNLTAGSTTAGQTGAFSITDLTTLFGSDTIKGDISGVVANDPTNSLYITQSSTASAPSLDPGNPAYSAIQAMANGFSQGTVLSGSAKDISIPKGDNGAYSDEAGASGSFGQFSSTKSQTTYVSTGSVVFDLYSAPEGTTGSATELGYFTLNGASDATNPGQLTYTALAAPEPSTYAMMFLGVGALVVMMRRRMA